MGGQEEKFERISAGIRDNMSNTDPKRKLLAVRLSEIREEELPAYAIYLWNCWGDGVTDRILLLDFARWKKRSYNDWRQIYEQLNPTGKYYCERWTGKYLGINIKESQLQTFTVAQIDPETYQPFDEKTFFLFVGANDDPHRTLKIHASEATVFGPPMEELIEYNARLVEQGAFKNYF